jgi:CrcB protein
MIRLLLIAIGGAAGSVARYLLSGFVQRVTTPYFPTGTFAVNVIGCLVVGFIGGIAATRSGFSPEARALLIVGLCGGFTTFSALSWETLELLRHDTLWRAGLNAGGQLIAGLAATWAGLALARSL